MATNPTQANRPIAITTPLGPDVLLLRNLTFREELGRPFQLYLDLQSTDANIDFASIVGQNVTVQVNLPTYQKRYFNGYVGTFKQVGFSGDLANYRATVVPWLWLLTRTSDCRIYQNLSVPQIVQQVFQEFGFTDVQSALTATYPPLPFCVQYNETAFHFVSRLLEQEGIAYYFNHTATTDTLVLCDAGSTAPTFPGYETIPYYAEKHVLHAPQHIYEWVIEQDVQPASYTLDDYDYQTPKADLLETATVDQSYAQGGYARFAYPGNYQTGDQGKSLATICLQEEQARQAVQRGTANALGLAAGYQFQFTSYPRQDQNVAMLTTGVILRITTADFSTGDAGGDFSSVCQFKTLTLGRPFRPARTTPKPRIAGPQTATVVGASGTEVDADSYGNVVVQFHWDRQGQNNDQSSCRLRVSQNSAGTQWGSMFIPHVGNEVIVSFEDGDPDRPLVTGRVYNGDEMPAQNPSTYPYVSSIYDSSQQNMLSMDATSGAEKLVVQNFANKITMDSTTGAENLTITDGASTITFDPTKGSVTTTTPGDQDTTNEGNTHKWTWGEWSDWIFGLKVSNVFGMAWNFYMGIYTKFIVGAEIGMILGGKFEVVAPFSFKITKGWQVERNTMGKIWALPAKVEFTNTSTKMVEGARLVTVTGTNQETINGESIEIVTAAKNENYGSLSTKCAAASSETVVGVKSITAANVSLTSTMGGTLYLGSFCTINGSAFTVDAPIINLG